MEFLVAVFFFILGTIIGSFLNVVILRFNTKVTLGGRSRCFSCGKEIKWYDLFPLGSFILLGGRCRFCKSKLSFQYPIVEALTGILFLGVFLKYFYFGLLIFSLGNSLSIILDLVVMSVLVVIAVYDLRHKVIPDLMVVVFIILSLVRLFLYVPIPGLFDFPYILDILAGPILALPIFLLWLVSGGKWIGLGDAKLSLGIGWFLGFSLGTASMIMGFWIGALVGLSLIGFSKLANSHLLSRLSLPSGIKNLGMKSEVPLAPFLILGIFIAYFFNVGLADLGILLPYGL